MASLKALHEWCYSICQSYPNVEIKNMTTSFRDGLAFCAIIHKHRPDLIEFHSLSKHNKYENNQLAFGVAEAKLGIRALLDPSDMVSCEVPDRLSVITYLSQLYCFFTNAPHASATGLELSHVTDHTQFLKGVAPKTSPNHLSAAADLSDRGRPVSVCTFCRKQVHLVQRHLIEGSLYHRSCFRCKICGSTLFEGSYESGRESGALVCTHHLTEKQNALDDPRPQPGPPEDVFKGRGLGVTNKGSLAYLYTGKSDLQESVLFERLRSATLDERESGTEERIGDNADATVCQKEKTRKPSPPHPSSRVATRDRAGTLPIQRSTKSQEEPANELIGSCRLSVTTADLSVLGVGGRPVPAPRRMLVSSSAVPPQPAPRNRTLKKMDSSPKTDSNADLSKSPPKSSCSPGPAVQVRKPRDPPWMDMVHPGPWTRLPPAPPPIKAPLPASRSSASFSPRGEWYRHRVAPSNPFGEAEEDVPFGNGSETRRRDDGPSQSSSPAVRTSNGESHSDKMADAVDAMSSEDIGNACGRVTSVEAEEDPKPNVTADAPKEDGSATGGGHFPTPLPRSSSHSFVSPSEVSTSDVRSKTVDGTGTGEQEVPGFVRESSGVVGALEAAECAGGVLVLHLDEEGGLAGRPGDPHDTMTVGSVGEPEDLARTACSNRGETSDLTRESAGLSVVDMTREVGFHRSNSSASNHSIRETTRVASEPGPADLAVAGATGGLAGAEEPLTKCFPRSASVPAIPSALPQRPSRSSALVEEGESEQAFVAPSRSKTCKENTFAQKGGLSKSTTFQGNQPTRAAAPGHGFPLIKRKVLTDPFLPVVELNTEKGELKKCLEKLELRGVELERSLRDCRDDKQEENMLVDWFTLIHKKHKLVCREAELVYITKQQMLEERQADVEYELRCLLNKPESDWSAEDRGREQQLMAELVTVIEQRNQIVSGLDRDRKREKEEDQLLTDIITKKDFQKEGLKEPKKSKGKFKPMKVLKMLSQKAESTKDSMTKGAPKKN